MPGWPAGRERAVGTTRQTRRASNCTACYSSCLYERRGVSLSPTTDGRTCPSLRSSEIHQGRYATAKTVRSVTEFWTEVQSRRPMPNDRSRSLDLSDLIIKHLQRKKRKRSQKYRHRGVSHRCISRRVGAYGRHAASVRPVDTTNQAQVRTLTPMA